MRTVQMAGMPHRLRSGFATAFMVAALAGGCATLPGGSIDGSAVRPLSDMPPSSAAQNRAKISVELGMAYFEVGRFDIALDEARAALGHDGGYAPAYHLMGLVYMYLNDQAAARQSFERAIAAAPNDPEFNNSYGWFQCATGQEQDGLQRLAAAARNPYYRFPARALTNAGLCQLRLRDEAAAAEQFRRALMLDPANEQASYQLAAIAYRAGDLDGARKRVAEMHRVREPSAATLWLALLIERRAGNTMGEVNYASQLRSRFADSPEYQALSEGRYE